VIAAPMLLGSDMIYVKRGSKYLFLQDPTVFTAVPGALADHTADGSIHHTWLLVRRLRACAWSTAIKSRACT
jgi:hypothetical protein